MPSVFTKIINREIPAEILFEDELCLAFMDIAPKAPVHFLVIPKREITAMSDLTEEDESTMGRCMVVAAKVAREQGLAPGYRVVVNCGDDGGQEVPHIHLHVLGGRKLSWPPG